MPWTALDCYCCSRLFVGETPGLNEGFGEASMLAFLCRIEGDETMEDNLEEKKQFPLTSLIIGSIILLIFSGVTILTYRNFQASAKHAEANTNL